MLDKASEKGLKYAERIAESMGFGMNAVEMGFLPVKIVPASKLEKNNYYGNAHRNSIQFDNSNRTLYIREEVLADLPRVAQIATNIFAHLTVDDHGSSLARDDNPNFQQLYLSALQHSYQLMFMNDIESIQATDSSLEMKKEDNQTKASAYGTSALSRRLQQYTGALQMHKDWKAERLRVTGPMLPISAQYLHDQTTAALRDGIDASDQDVIESALTARSNMKILRQLHENLTVAAASGDHMLWKMIKGKIDKAELRTEMANIRTRKASLLTDTFNLALRRVA